MGLTEFERPALTDRPGGGQRGHWSGGHQPVSIGRANCEVPQPHDTRGARPRRRGIHRRGPDRRQRDAQNPTQQRIAEAYVDQLGEAAVFPAPIVTTVSPAAEFFPADAYHQDFLNSNPTHPYIAANDVPKVDALKKLFPAEYRSQPVLVHAGGQ